MAAAYNALIKDIFSQVPRTYELSNQVLTLGLDRYWRRKAAKIASNGGGGQWLDVCSGTGQMAAYLCNSALEQADVIALDFSLPMLREIQRKQGSNKIHPCIGDAGNLPFSDNTFDLVTISFATRNINVTKDALLKCLQEFRRVLKPEGRLVNLETSQPPSRLVRKLFHLYVRTFVKPVGYLISGSKVAYAYLSSTIPNFFTALEFSNIMREAGYCRVAYHHMTLGLAAIHVGAK